MGELQHIVEAHRTGKFPVHKTVERAIEQITRLNPTLNFLAMECFEQAVAEAALERDLSLPLAGVPVLIKDMEDVAGLPTRKGSLTTSSSIATSDSTVPARLKAAGAIVVGKSTMPEWAIEGYTANRATGITRNPWNLDYSPGGSSGGSASAMAAGAIPFATATDGGGSIRIPASFCGLVGLKPTNGVIGRWPKPDWIDYSTEGPFATSVSDLRLLMQVLAGPVDGDPVSKTIDIDFAAPNSTMPTQIVAMTRTSDLGPIDPEVELLFTSAVNEFSALTGASVEWRDPGSLFSFGEPDEDWFTVASVEHLESIGRDFYVKNRENMHVSSQEFFDAALGVDIREYLAARDRQVRYIRAFDEVVHDRVVLLTPTVSYGGWLADGRMPDQASVHGLPPAAYNTALQNITNNPAVCIPIGVLANGVPCGMQIVAGHWHDAWLLDLAQQWERANPWSLVARGYESFCSTLG